MCRVKACSGEWQGQRLADKKATDPELCGMTILESSMPANAGLGSGAMDRPSELAAKGQNEKQLSVKQLPYRYFIQLW